MPKLVLPGGAGSLEVDTRGRRSIPVQEVASRLPGGYSLDPVRYKDIIATQRPRQVPPTPPHSFTHPPSLERPPANRPWRTAEPDSG